MTLLAMRYGAGSPQGSISLAADDATVTVAAGSTVDISLIVTRTNWTGTVSLAVSGLPSGVTGSFSDSSLTGGETTSVLTLTADPAAGVVTNYAFTITASGSGVTDATVAGTCTVVASSARGIPTSTGIIKQDQFAYANDAALKANFPATEGSFDFTKLYSYVAAGGVSDYSLISLDSSVQFEGHSTLKATLTDSAGPYNIQVYFGTSPYPDYAEVAMYAALGFSNGWTTVGTQSGQSNGYKIISMGYDTASGRTGIEFANPDNFSNTTGWTNSGPGNQSASSAYDNKTSTTLTSGLAQAVAPPFSPRPTDVGGAWSGTGFLCLYMEFRRETSTRARCKYWAWMYGTTPPVNPMSDLSVDVATGTMPRIENVQIGLNYNHGFGFRPTAPMSIYWGDWRVYDLSVNSNPLNLY